MERAELLPGGREERVPIPTRKRQGLLVCRDDIDAPRERLRVGALHAVGRRAINEDWIGKARQQGQQIREVGRRRSGGGFLQLADSPRRGDPSRGGYRGRPSRQPHEPHVHVMVDPKLPFLVVKQRKEALADNALPEKKNAHLRVREIEGGVNRPDRNHRVGGVDDA